MNTFPMLFVFLFIVLDVGVLAGFIVGCIYASGAHAEHAAGGFAHDTFGEYEHQSDAPYPRIGD